MGYEQIFRLDGRKALVAGASRGIGAAIARGLAGAGAHTVLAARTQESLENEAAGLREQGYSVETALLDVTDPDSVEALGERHGDADILVNVAGTNIRKAFVDYTAAEYERLLSVNLHGLVRLTQITGKRMIEKRRGGKVVFIGSLLSSEGLPNISIYTITKSAIGGLTRSLAAEWGPHNIQVNCICPGFILTTLNQDMWQPVEMRKWLEGAQSNPEMGTPEDIAPAAVFLSSRASDYVTGQLLFVDGGYSTTRRWPFHP